MGAALSPAAQLTILQSGAPAFLLITTFAKKPTAPRLSSAYRTRVNVVCRRSIFESMFRAGMLKILLQHMPPSVQSRG
jgi:hypothetical protein